MAEFGYDSTPETVAEEANDQTTQNDPIADATDASPQDVQDALRTEQGIPFAAAVEYDQADTGSAADDKGGRLQFAMVFENTSGDQAAPTPAAGGDSGDKNGEGPPEQPGSVPDDADEPPEDRSEETEEADDASSKEARIRTAVARVSAFYDQYADSLVRPAERPDEETRADFAQSMQEIADEGGLEKDETGQGYGISSSQIGVSDTDRHTEIMVDVRHNPGFRGQPGVTVDIAKAYLPLNKPPEYQQMQYTLPKDGQVVVKSVKEFGTGARTSIASEEEVGELIEVVHETRAAALTVHEPEPKTVNDGQDLISVPRYAFAGDAEGLEETGIGIEIHLRNRPPKVDVPEVTDIYRQHIGDVEEAVLTTGRKLGLDLRSRMRPIDHMHIHPERYRDDISALSEGQQPVSGMSMVDGHIHVVENSRDVTRTLTDVGHELLHNATQEEILVRDYTASVYEKGMGGYHGYRDRKNGDFGTVQEALIEFGSIQNVREEWQHYPRLEGTETDNYCNSYTPPMFILDHVIQQTDDPSETFWDLQYGMYTGDRDTLPRRLVPVIGESGVQALAQMNDASEASIRETAHALGCESILPGNLQEIRWGNVLRWVTPLR